MVTIAVLVGLAVWLVLDGGARPARTVLPVASGGRARPRRRGPFGRRGRLPEADLVRMLVAQVGALLRAGAAPGVAWQRVAGVPVDARGVPDVGALARVTGGTRPATAVVAACRLSVDVGAPLGTVLDEVARALAAEAEARAEREAALAGPRATARILTWLPALGVLLGLLLGADPLGTLLGGGLGSVGFVLGVLLLLAGRRWTGRLVARARAAGEEA